MVFDAYDTSHNHSYEHTIDVYKNDTVCEDTLNTLIEYPSHAIQKMNEIRSAFPILDCRQITCIGFRVLGNNNNWILINVWRDNRPVVRSVEL